MGEQAGVSAALALQHGAPLLARALSEVERQIEHGWVAAASGYREIRDEQLYVQGPYGDFETYSRDRWGVRRDYVDS